MRLRAAAASPWPYVAWGLVSAVGLAIADHVDPYVLVAAFYVAALLSAAAVAFGAWGGWRTLLFALLAAVPTALALWRLSTIRWA